MKRFPQDLKVRFIEAMTPLSIAQIRSIFQDYWSELSSARAREEATGDEEAYAKKILFYLRGARDCFASTSKPGLAEWTINTYFGGVSWRLLDVFGESFGDESHQWRKRWTVDEDGKLSEYQDSDGPSEARSEDRQWFENLQLDSLDNFIFYEEDLSLLESVIKTLEEFSSRSRREKSYHFAVKDVSRFQQSWSTACAWGSIGFYATQSQASAFKQPDHAITNYLEDLASCVQENWWENWKKDQDNA